MDNKTSFGEILTLTILLLIVGWVFLVLASCRGLDKQYNYAVDDTVGVGLTKYEDNEAICYIYKEKTWGTIGCIPKK